MPTYKNIRVPKRGGGTRLQRVQVLKSGKYKFVKNIGKSVAKKVRKKAKRVRTRGNPSRSKRMAKGKLFKNLSGAGAIEDLAWGFIGQTVLANQVGEAVALPMTRTIQGIVGHALNRRGKGRMIYGIIDLIDLYLVGAWGGQIPMLGELTQALKIRPL